VQYEILECSEAKYLSTAVISSLKVHTDPGSRYIHMWLHPQVSFQF